MSANRWNSRKQVSSCICWLSLLFVAFFSFFVPIKQVEAASVPTGFQDRRIASGLTSPATLTALPDGRVLAVQQNGVIRIIKGDVMLSTPFYGVPNVNSGSERGCLGITPDPDFATNHFVYIYCTINNATGHNNRVLRVTEANDRVVDGSQVTIFQLPNVPGTTRFHMGGALRFGSDGMLYVAVGNHEDSPQNPSNSQRLTNPFGKILRITKTGGIPSDNPFASRTDAGRSIWALGFRNPFAFDIQRGTGRIFSGDVGQGATEEVDDVVRAGNYGWPFFEGTTQRIAPPGGFVHRPPFFQYSHSGGRCSITGVGFYNPPSQQFPEVFRGKYFYQDFCGGTIRRLDPAGAAPGRGDTSFATGLSFPTNMVISADGSLYYLERNQQTGVPTPGGGRIGKITFTASQAPRCNLFPDDATVSVGQSATFRAGADGATSLQWQRADSATPTSFSNITGATGTSFTLTNAQLSDNGDLFRMRATNSFGSVNCGPATLTVTSNRFPTAIIDLPVGTTEFVAGQPIAFSGRGTDPEDGTIPTARKTWQIDWRHDVHPHPQLEPTTGIDGGNFTVPDLEGSEANVWLRIFLTVEDSGGLTNSAFRDIFPSRQLSSMTPTGTPINGFGPFERDMSNGGSGAGDGRTITLAGIPYLKGLGVHANSDLRFNIAGCTGSFVSDIGVDDEVGDLGSVIFRVLLDGQQVFDSGVLRGPDNRVSVAIPVSGRSELRLVVTDGGDGINSDHADWAGARVTGCTAAPGLSITNMQVRDTANAADWSIRSNLQNGNQAFGDRAYTFSNVGSFAGSAWIRTAADSKGFTGNPLVTFDINVAADVFVAIDDRVGRRSWMDSTWVDTGINVNTLEGTTTRTQSVFRKRFNAGQVSLGPQGSSTAANYSIFVKP